MPVPAVSVAPPLAVLVLAWGEATPAVRALVDATQASVPIVESMLVLVPQADAPGQLSAEEYLPLPALAPEPAPAPPEPTADAPAPVPAAESAPPTVAQPIYLTAGIDKELVAPAENPTALAPPVPLAWSAVRVLRLSSLSLPQLAQRAGQPLPGPTWLGPATAPAAPYLGATAPASQPEVVIENKPNTYTKASTVPAQLPKATESAAPTVPGPQPTAEAGFPAEPVPLYDPIAQAPDPEADLPASGLDEAEPAAAEIAADDLAEFDEPDLPAPLPAAQAGWPEALAALRHPAGLPEPPAAPATASPVPAAHPALRPAAAHYPAPDLNFQVIQYARFAVPVVLAEAPFAVVYAPAWPTWLAAQELRQRTGRPLVLHVSTLAAAEDESVETATGWVAELQRQTLRRADLLLAETPALARRLCRDLGLPTSAVQIVPAADAAAIAKALHAAQLRPAPGSASSAQGIS